MAKNPDTSEYESTVSAVRCLQSAGSIVRFNGEPLALVFLADGSLAGLDDQGNHHLIRFIHGRWSLDASWNLDQMANSAEINCHAELSILANGSELGVWSFTGVDPLWWMDSGVWITCLSAHSHLGLLATGHDDGSVRIWNLADGTMEQCWRLQSMEPNANPNSNKGYLSALAWHPLKPELIVSNEFLRVHHLAMKNESPMKTLHGHKGRIVALGWDPLGRYLYSGGWDATVRVWDAITGSARMILNNHAALITTVAMSHCGKWLVAGDSSPSWSLWEVDTWRRIGGQNILPSEPRQAVFSKIAEDGSSFLALGLEDHRVLVLAGGATFPSPNHDLADPYAVRPSLNRMPNGGYQCLGLEGGLQEWILEADEGTTLGDCRAHYLLDSGGHVQAMAVSTDGNLILTQEIPFTLTNGNKTSSVQEGANSKSLRVWRLVESGISLRLESILEGLPVQSSLLAISSCGSYWAVASPLGADLHLWDASSAIPLGLIPDPLAGSAMLDLAFSPDGSLLAVCGMRTLGKAGDGLVVVVEVKSGLEKYRLNRGAWRLAWHASGNYLGLATPSGALLGWSLQSNSVQEFQHNSQSPIACLAFTQRSQYMVASSGDRFAWIYAGKAIMPCGTIELPGPILALSAGHADEEVAALIAGGDGWSINLPAWLVEQTLACK